MTTYKILVFTEALDGVDFGGESEASTLKALFEGDYLSLSGREAVRILDVADGHGEPIELPVETMVGIDNVIMNEKKGMTRTKFVVLAIERYLKELAEAEYAEGVEAE